MERAETSEVLSSPVRFLLSVLGLIVVAGAVLVDFGLLAGSYGVMLGGGNYIGNFKLADVAALLPVLVVFSMGYILTEARGITNLGLHRVLLEELRGRLFWITLLMIVTLALTGAGLIHLEGILLAKGTALGTDGSAIFLPAPMWTRMGLAFFLPFLIASWAVPFEALLRVFRAPRV